MIPAVVDLSDQLVRTAFDTAVGQDAVVVVTGQTTGPATAHRPGVLRVGAIGADDRLVGRYPPGAIDVLAPGDGVVSLSANGSDEIVGSGTDFAVPFVAGLATLVRAAAPGLSAPAVTQKIESGADHLGGSIPDPVYGFGIINPAAAMSTSLDDVPLAVPLAHETGQAGGTPGPGGATFVAILAGCALALVGVTTFLRRKPRGRAGRGRRAVAAEPTEVVN
jgi:subtilisin family serine protease